MDRLEVADPEKLAYLTQTTLSVTTRRARSQRLRRAVSQDRGAAEGRHLLRHAEPAGGGPHAVAAGRRGAGRGQPEQLQQPAAGRDGPATADVPSHLIDGPADIDPAWFSGGETVLITAGASAPENVVQECIALLRERFDAAVESCTLFQEQISFLLPPSLAGRETVEHDEKGGECFHHDETVSVKTRAMP